MSNSPLVVHTNISPNKTSPRKQAIDTITIHCVVGQCTAESLGKLFADSSRQASSNYGVDKDGRIGMYVEEKDRSWCSSNSANDHRAITIEVASDTTAPYAVNDKAYAALIELVADICKRNNIKQLLWKGDKSLIGQVDKQNMTVHRWFANKSCPGDYLYERHGDIAAKVNAILNGSATETIQPNAEPAKITYKVQCGSFSNKDNAQALAAKLKAAGFDTYIVAETVEPVESAPVETPAPEATPAPTPSATIEKGSKVKVKSGAKTYTGGKIASFVYDREYVVDELVGDRAVLDKNGLCTAFNVNDLVLVDAAAPAEEPKEEPVDLWEGIRYWKPDEFKCRCGEYHAPYCDGFPVQPDRKLLELADDIRHRLGAPAIRSSGIRCEMHNLDSGGVANSRHLYGKALDFRVKGYTAEQVLAEVKKDPRTRYAYAIDDTYVHMDVE